MSFVSQPATEPSLFPVTLAKFLLNEPRLTFSWLGMALLSGYVFYRITWGSSSKPSYGSIPAVGGSDLLSWSSLNFTEQTNNMIQTGYDEYKGRLFRVPQIDHWYIIVSGRKHIEELANAPSDVLSFQAANEETMFVSNLLGPTVDTSQYHIDIIRTGLTRNLNNLFGVINDEIELAFEENIPRTDEWKAFIVYPVITQIVARASNRIFVGLPLCRNSDYLDLAIRFTFDVIRSGDRLRRVPAFLRGIVAPVVATSLKTTRLTWKHLGPVIEERQRLMDEYGLDYPDKPNDLLSWLMDIAEGDERSQLTLTTRILGANLAAIHTSSRSLMHALFDLAAQPKYLAPLREEVESVVREDGWSKVAMTKLHKVDSFLKESQRFNGLRLISLVRKALKDYTFSDGTFIPKGAHIGAAARPIHLDDAIYPNAGVFDGFRFSDMQEKAGQEVSNKLINTNLDYMAFGHGKHACPGRFFVAHELKSIFAHLVLNYDVKMENEGVRPPNTCFGFNIVPDDSARVMFRRRQTA